jgi:SAM-dependent methyltransferase
MAGGLKSLAKRTVARLFRPALWPLVERLDRVEGLLARTVEATGRTSATVDEQARLAATRHGEVDRRVGQVEDLLERVAGWTVQREKHGQELAFWRWLATTPQGQASVGGSYQRTFGRWQRDRLRELGRALDLLGEAGDGPRLDPAYAGVLSGTPEELARLDAAVDQWCRLQRVVEIGGGPFPAIAAAAGWRSAIAIDPIARRYVEEGLTPAGAAGVVFVESPGERTPLASGSADLVIIENALDHVSDPEAVLAEIARLVRDEGLLWVLVDLSNYSDAMHPHPFSEDRIRGLLARHGFEVVADRVSTHKSHPEAYGEYRGLVRKRAGSAAIVVRARHAEHSAGRIEVASAG